MKNKFLLIYSFLFCMFLSVLAPSCSKPDAAAATTCADKNLQISATTTNTSGGTATNGAIAATATNSNGFTYNINGGAFQASGNFTGLAAGNFTVGAKDDAGCTVSKSFTVAASACPTILVTGVVTNATSSTATNGAIVASASGSTGITFSINGGAFQATGTFNNLAIGSYTITAKDANGCIGTANIPVSTASCPTITVGTVVVAASGPTTNNGTITVTAGAGAAPYMYSKDGTNFQTSNLFNNLAANTYTIIVKDANACLGTSGNVILGTNCPTFSVNTAIIGSDKCANNTGRITVTASGGTGITYALNNGSFQASNVFNSLAVGNYVINIKDANGCVNTNPPTANVAQAPAGPLFAAVKTLMLSRCATAGCHNATTQQSGYNFTDDCQIVGGQVRIKARAVDNNPSSMPQSGPLPATDKQKITDWINAGGLHSN